MSWVLCSPFMGNLCKEEAACLWAHLARLCQSPLSHCGWSQGPGEQRSPWTVPVPWVPLSYGNTNRAPTTGKIEDRLRNVERPPTFHTNCVCPCIILSKLVSSTNCLDGLYSHVRNTHRPNRWKWKSDTNCLVTTVISALACFAKSFSNVYKNRRFRWMKCGGRWWRLPVLADKVLR